jgi:hypothetical protein
MQRRHHRPALFSLLVLLAAVMLSGCRPKPKAPALLDDPVFQSDEGFRFLVPEGWIMAARGTVPSGPLDKERLLVQYNRADGDAQATLEVSVADFPEDANLADYLSGPSFTASQWKQSGSQEKLDAGGRPGVRYRFSARVNKAVLAKEVTAFHRGGRVYFFTLLFAPADATAPEQIRRAISRLVWTK